MLESKIIPSSPPLTSPPPPSSSFFVVEKQNPPTKKDKARRQKRKNDSKKTNPKTIVLSMMQIPLTCPFTLHSDAEKKAFSSLIMNLKHPYILPVSGVKFDLMSNNDSESSITNVNSPNSSSTMDILVARKLCERGSLRDEIYGVGDPQGGRSCEGGRATGAGYEGRAIRPLTTKPPPPILTRRFALRLDTPRCRFIHYKVPSQDQRGAPSPEEDSQLWSADPRGYAGLAKAWDNMLQPLELQCHGGLGRSLQKLRGQD